MNKIILTTSALFLFFNVHYALAEAITRDQAVQMMAECKTFRVQKIAPLKAKEIDRCVEKGKELASCERFYNDFGETYIAANGYQQIGMFWDAPICKQALDLEKYFGLYPGKESFNAW